MTKREDPENRDDATPAAIHCRRTGQEYDADEHMRCPYCFGTESVVQDGKHTDFCDFDPEKDPTHFGFPGDSTRDLKG